MTSGGMINVPSFTAVGTDMQIILLLIFNSEI
jgi:hypothetical protein